MSDPSKTPPTDGTNQTLSDRVRSLRLGGEKGNGSGSSSLFRLLLLSWAVGAVLLLTTMAFGYRAYRVDRAYADLDEGKETVSQGKKKPTLPGTYSGSDTEDTTSPGEVILQAKGYVIPVSLIQVSPKVGGQLWDIADGFREGAIFYEDDILAYIEDTDYKAEYLQAKATYSMAGQKRQEIEKSMPLEIQQAEADLEETRENAAQMKLEMDRNRRLRMSNGVAQKEFEQAQYGYTSMAARAKRLEVALKLIREGRQSYRIESARLEEEQSRAMYEKARWRYRNTKIRVPVTGMILSKKAEKGNMVNPSAFSSGISASLCEMADLRELEVDLSIQERDIARVRQGMPCLVMPEAYNNDKPFLKKHPRGYEGFVSRLMPTADRAKGAIPVRVKIAFISEEEAGKYLRPEMSALVSFLEGPAAPGKK